VNLPGPAALGRSVVVSGDTPPPVPWSGAAEVVVDDDALAAPAALVATLHDGWVHRRPLVIRLQVDPRELRTPSVITAEPWSLRADTETWSDRVQFLVWANSYDARPKGEPVWWWARKAVRLGAHPATGPGDVVLADGEAAWVDGGPRQPFAPDALGGLHLVHAESVERGSLAPAPPVRPPRADLAADQLAAVAHDAGPARVVAPAGSGKTRVLTERLRHLVVDRGWERDCLLAIAYNKQAQEELDRRSADFAPRTRTLNSLGLSVLTRARGRTPNLLGERDLRRIVEGLAPVRARRSNTDPIGPYLEALSAVRLGLRDPGEVEASRDDVPGLAALWPAWRDALQRAGGIDFDEQIYGAIAVLLGDGTLRNEMRLSCRHLLVDEFQDLTPAHLLLVRLLASPGLDCFGVGDDDQVIYGHAGADPGFLIDFARLFPGAADHRLEVNYRCPPAVVDSAVRLLSHNRRRVAKTIRAGRTASGGLEVVAHPPGAGVTAALERVHDWLERGSAAGEIAVLTRVNALTLAPIAALVQADVPVASTARPDVLERTGVRAALAYLRIATAPEDHIGGAELAEVLRRPSRGLPPWVAERLRRRASWSARALVGLAGRAADKDAAKLGRFVDDVAALRAAASSSDSASLLRYVRVEVGLGGAMALLDGGRGGEGSSHLDDLEALEAVAALHPDAAGFEPWLRRLLARPATPGGVVVSTVHRVKGREWDRVLVYGVNAGLFPHRLAEDVEEERRVLHVAVTRGREDVVVLADAARPSPMLVELDEAASPADPGPTAARRAGPAAPPPRSKAEEPPRGDPELEELLRTWRRQRAAADGVPAYVVFPDRTLGALAARRPRTLAELRQVEGIGPARLDAYGEALLALLTGPADPGARSERR